MEGMDPIQYLYKVLGSRFSPSVPGDFSPFPQTRSQTLLQSRALCERVPEEERCPLGTRCARCHPAAALGLIAKAEAPEQSAWPPAPLPAPAPLPLLPRRPRCPPACASCAGARLDTRGRCFRNMCAEDQD